MLTKLIVIIISQYMHISNHYAVYLKLIQCYMSSIFSIKLEKIKLGTGQKKKEEEIHGFQSSVFRRVCCLKNNAYNPI